jgi:hypothetical protein
VPSKRDLFGKPHIPNLPTNQWQSRLTSRNLDKKGHLPKPGIRFFRLLPEIGEDTDSDSIQSELGSSGVRISDPSEKRLLTG